MLTEIVWQGIGILSIAAGITIIWAIGREWRPYSLKHRLVSVTTGIISGIIGVLLAMFTVYALMQAVYTDYDEIAPIHHMNQFSFSVWLLVVAALYYGLTFAAGSLAGFLAPKWLSKKVILLAALFMGAFINFCPVVVGWLRLTL